MIPKQLDLFQTHLPKRLRCGDEKHAPLIRTQKHALRRKYIQVNPPWLRAFIVLDLDYEGSALAWYDENMLPPLWTSMNMLNAHSHIAYGINAPVLLGHHDRQKPMRYLAAVESAMRAKLRGDPGYSGLITKNPIHSHWRNCWNHSGMGVYDLADLADCLDLPKHAPKAKPEQVGVGRNVDTFDHIRHLSYREVRAWKRAHGRGAYIYWQKWLYDSTLDYTGNEHATPLDHRECHWIAKSVAHWTWTKFDVEASDKRFSALQSFRGKQGGRPVDAGSERQNEPWKALGISKRTYYRRKKAKAPNGWHQKP